jgi:beta-N-acetylhexosaminidase
MLAHVIYEGVDRQRPASLSPLHARELLREHLGFQGVAVSDDLEMAPIRTGLGVPAAAVQAVAAGCDLVLTAHSAHNAVDAVRALALRADRDGAFRERLREARGRVRTMRATLNRRVPPNPYRETPEALQREVLQRVRGLREPRYRDPTR